MTDHPGNAFDSGRNDPRATGDGSALGSVAALVEAGLPLESGLRALSEEAPTRRLRKTLRTMSSELAAGASPDEVLSRGGRGLPLYVRGLVRAGVQHGQLGMFLEEFLLAVRHRRAARQSYWLALAYPVLLLPFAVLAASGLAAMVVPQFKDIFNDFGVELPSITVFMINVVEFLTPTVLIGFLLGVILLPVALPVMMPLMFSPPGWTRFVQRLPVIGTPSRMRGMSEFCSFLGLLVSGGIPLGTALDMTAGAVGDPNLKSGARKLATRVEAGELMQDGARRLPHFSAELRSLFHWESRGRTFGDMLRHAGRVFAARSQVQIGMVGLIFQPLLLLLIGGFLGMIVLALFMPLVKLLNELS